MGKKYFDLEGIEGDDVELTPSPENAVEEAEAVAEVAEAMTPDPEPAPAAPAAPPEPVVPLELHSTSAAAGKPYPTEDPGDDTTIWSPRPGLIGSNRQGFRKIK